MSRASPIEWTDATWNPVTGCAKVSAGCKHCYAARHWPRLSHNPATVYAGRDFTEVRCHPERLAWPRTWRRPRRVFVNSMSDLFHEAVPDDFINAVFEAMRAAPHHIFQVLTKRPERMRQGLRQVRRPLPNVWLGVSCEDQATANARIPPLLDTPAAIRFVSLEPLISPVDLRAVEIVGGVPMDVLLWTSPHLDWVIVGGESGPQARPMPLDWVRALRDQCQYANIPFHFKQWGGANKKKTGRLLDGREWNDYPT